MSCLRKVVEKLTLSGGAADSVIPEGAKRLSGIQEKPDILDIPPCAGLRLVRYDY